MSTEPSETSAGKADALMMLDTFLQDAPPFITKRVGVNITRNSNMSRWDFQLPVLWLYCGSDTCNDFRFFDSVSKPIPLESGLVSSTRRVLFGSFCV